MHERKCHLVLLLGLGVLGAAASPSEKPADSTRASLRHFVRTTHWDEKSPPLTMPNPSLTDSQIADVVSYILSLRKWMQRRSVATMVCFAYFAYFAYFAVILSHRLLVGVARPRCPYLRSLAHRRRLRPWVF